MLVPAGSTHGTLGGGTEPVSEAEGEAGAAGGHPVPPPLLRLTQTQSIHSLALLTTLLAINPRKGLAWPSRSAQGSSDGKWDFYFYFFHLALQLSGYLLSWAQELKFSKEMLYKKKKKAPRGTGAGAQVGGWFREGFLAWKRGEREMELGEGMAQREGFSNEAKTA